MAEQIPMAMCPMAETCKGMMSARKMPAVMFVIPGIVFIALGLVVIVEPQILVWLVGLFFIAMGCMTFLCVRFMRQFSERIRDSQQ